MHITFLTIVGAVLLFVLSIFLLAVWALSALVRAIRGGNRSSEDRRRTDSALSDIRQGVQRMDRRIGSLETILLPEGRASGEVR